MKFPKCTLCKNATIINCEYVGVFPIYGMNEIHVVKGDIVFVDHPNIIQKL
jgi:hypothetical protein